MADPNTAAHRRPLAHLSARPAHALELQILNGAGYALTFYTLAEAKIVVESWRRHFNTVRPHRSLGYKPPAPEVFVPP